MQLRKLALDAEKKFSVTTCGHFFVIRFGSDSVEDLSLHFGLNQMLEMQLYKQNERRQSNSGGAKGAV